MVPLRGARCQLDHEGVEFLGHRPYPPTGLTTARWRHVEPSSVRIETLTFTQYGVELEALLRGTRRDGSDDYPHVVVWRGRAYLEDGHTRVARLWLLGEREVTCRVYRLRRRRR